MRHLKKRSTVGIGQFWELPTCMHMGSVLNMMIYQVCPHGEENKYIICPS